MLNVPICIDKIHSKMIKNLWFDMSANLSVAIFDFDPIMDSWRERECSIAAMQRAAEIMNDSHLLVRQNHYLLFR